MRPRVHQPGPDCKWQSVRQVESGAGVRFLEEGLQKKERSMPVSPPWQGGGVVSAGGGSSLPSVGSSRTDGAEPTQACGWWLEEASAGALEAEEQNSGPFGHWFSCPVWVTTIHG